ncbi:hypothetical protein ACFY3B_19420 [Micromonospora parva]|uniref:Uncharacterized protein n=1 Tax=Micromonospora parva TaxID=1464048 RepID=A0ABW6VVV5_9ACTN
MAISAHAHVPAANRLIDADTTNLTAIQRPADIRFPMSPAYAGRAAVPTEPTAEQLALGRKAWELTHNGPKALSDKQLAKRLGVTAAEVSDAVLAYLGSRECLARRARALFEGDATPAEMAAQLGVTESEVMDLVVDDIARETGWDRVRRSRAAHFASPVPPTTPGQRPAECPPWCSLDHRGHISEVDGFTIGLGHERVMAEVVGGDAVTIEGPACVSVFVESTTEAGRVTTPTRVTMSVADGTEGEYPGGEGVQGWTGTPEQAEQLAHALIRAAHTARTNR